MILNNAPQAEAILSNVGEIGEFRIRNSAKAFNILSSGLYANKIKAIIRELSCNAIDSHTAAGTTRPFEVHLPTTLEPWFSIRDFGTGLSHEQVTNIYTTYFESTKTNSNAFIGALGLGSKSPFSYTDNFTVTAIKDGRKGIYSAFINDEGVPSIALMNEEQVTEPNGVEVKFSVNDRYDFSKFLSEADSVYRWFSVAPKFTGAELNIKPMDYTKENIIPGVHQAKIDRYDNKKSIALMGNIAYPIDVPQADVALEGLHEMLNCGLVMEFDIGELDFQASREGLSYIPLTIDSIRNKLKQLNSALADVLAKDADAIENKWERSEYLYSLKSNKLWRKAVDEYATKTGFELFDVSASDYATVYEVELKVDDLAKMNILVRPFKWFNRDKCKNLKPDHNYREDYTYYNVTVSDNFHFVVNDTKVGSFERTKNHYRNHEQKAYNGKVMVLEKLDKTKEMDLVAFYTAIHNPPESQRFLVSALDEKPRAAHKGFGKNVSIMQLERRGGSSNRSASSDFVWRPAGTLDSFDANKTYYYVPMSGFKTLWNKPHAFSDMNNMREVMQSTQLPEFRIEVYGVRKGDIEAIKKLPNWKLMEDFVYDTISALSTKISNASVLESIDRQEIMQYNYQTVIDGIDSKSPAASLLSDFAGLPKIAGLHWLKIMVRRLGMEQSIDIKDEIVKYKQKFNDFSGRYPLINKFSSYANEGDVCEYINLVDKVKGV